MIRHIILWIVFLLLWVPEQATSQDLSDKAYFSISYFGVLGTHPGIRVGVQWPLITTNNSEQRLNQVVGGVNLVTYFHRRNHLGVGLYGEVAYRNRRLDKNNYEAAVGLGFLKGIRLNRLYGPDPNGKPIRMDGSGSTYLLKTLALGLGRNSDSERLTDFWNIRPTLMQISPYGIRKSFNIAVDAGYYFRF